MCGRCMRVLAVDHPPVPCCPAHASWVQWLLPGARCPSTTAMPSRHPHTQPGPGRRGRAAVCGALRRCLRAALPLPAPAPPAPAAAGGPASAPRAASARCSWQPCLSLLPRRRLQLACLCARRYDELIPEDFFDGLAADQEHPSPGGQHLQMVGTAARRSAPPACLPRRPRARPTACAGAAPPRERPPRRPARPQLLQPERSYAAAASGVPPRCAGHLAARSLRPPARGGSHGRRRRRAAAAAAAAGAAGAGAAGWAPARNLALLARS
jgi:hypothetical protein